MKKVLLLGLLLKGVCVKAVWVQLPSAQQLEQRLLTVVSEDFLEKTELVQKLADQKQTYFDVAKYVDVALYDYSNRYLDYPIIAKIPHKSRSSIIEAILADSPEAIKELQDKGYLDK